MAINYSNTQYSRLRLKHFTTIGQTPNYNGSDFTVTPHAPNDVQDREIIINTSDKKAWICFDPTNIVELTGGGGSSYTFDEGIQESGGLVKLGNLGLGSVSNSEFNEGSKLSIKGAGGVTSFFEFFDGTDKFNHSYSQSSSSIWGRSYTKPGYSILEASNPSGSFKFGVGGTQLELSDSNGYSANIKLLNNSGTVFQLPAKSGTQTFAMLSDLSTYGDAYLGNTQTFTGLNTFTQNIQTNAIKLLDTTYKTTLSVPSAGVLNLGNDFTEIQLRGLGLSGSTYPTFKQNSGNAGSLQILTQSSIDIRSSLSSVNLSGTSNSIYPTSNTGSNTIQVLGGSNEVSSGGFNIIKKATDNYSKTIESYTLDVNTVFRETTSGAITSPQSLIRLTPTFNYPTTTSGIVRTIYNNPTITSLAGGVEHRFIDSNHGNVYFKTCTNFQVFTDATVSAFRVDNATYTAGTSETRLVLLDLKTGTQKRVLFGADDSAGTGYKTLRVLN